MNEHQIRDYIHKLRRFYTDALIYGIVNLGLISSGPYLVGIFLARLGYYWMGDWSWSTRFSWASFPK